MAKVTKRKRGKGGRFVKSTRKVRSTRAPTRRYASGVVATRRRRSNPKSIVQTPAVRLGVWFLGGAAISTWASRQEWIRRYAPGGVNAFLWVAALVFLVGMMLFKGKMRQNIIALAFGIAAPAAIEWGSNMELLGGNGNGEPTTDTSSAITRRRRQYRPAPGRAPSSAVAAAMTGRDYPRSA